MSAVTDEEVEAANYILWSGDNDYVNPMRAALEAVEAVREPDLLPGLRQALEMLDSVTAPDAGIESCITWFRAEIARREQSE